MSELPSWIIAPAFVYNRTFFGLRQNYGKFTSFLLAENYDVEISEALYSSAIDYIETLIEANTIKLYTLAQLSDSEEIVAGVVIPTEIQEMKIVSYANKYRSFPLTIYDFVKIVYYLSKENDIHSILRFLFFFGFKFPGSPEFIVDIFNQSQNDRSIADISRDIVPRIKSHKEEIPVLGPGFIILNLHEKKILGDKKKRLELEIARLTAELGDLNQRIKNLPE
ncbi:hypothetical protein ACTFIY_004583 [Dictyostelium cf. discoideum]